MLRKLTETMTYKLISILIVCSQLSNIQSFSASVFHFDIFQREDKTDSEGRFFSWTKVHKKEYGNTEEYMKRLNIFQENEQLVNDVNAQKLGYTLELNQFADLTWQEFQNQYLTNAAQHCSATREGNHERSNSLLPDAVDWRKKGIVSPVKNQGSCGSCWTFSTTGAMEAHMALSWGLKFNLSEQQLVDCAQAFNNKGCHGGLPSQAFEYIHYNKGLMEEKNYPYTAKDGKCKFKPNLAVAFVDKIVNITEYDEDMLEDAVANAGPVSIAYQVASDFRFYKKGVYSSKVCQSDPMHVNHAVLAVGYDVTDDGTKYWIVKNSWGKKFGMNGYFYIERGQNMCGLSDCASYPVVNKNRN